jgi:Domain of unknown function DUF11
MIQKRMGRRLSLLFLAIAATPSIAGDIELPGDVAVTLTASPTVNLTPGEPIQFTVTATNLGPAAIQQGFVLQSSQIVDQLDIGAAKVDGCFLYVEVVDLRNGGSYYLVEWQVVGAPGGPTSLGVGETATCHFSMPITSFAPSSQIFSMNLGEIWRDPNPNDDSASVLLQRAPIPAPATSMWALLLLAGLVVCGGLESMHAKARLSPKTRQSKRDSRTPPLTISRLLCRLQGHTVRRTA